MAYGMGRYSPMMRLVSALGMELAPAIAEPEQSFQFQRTGYFVADRRDHTAAQPVFNRSVTLRDRWSA